MFRFASAVIVLCVASPAFAQDVSLDMILKDGEGWKLANGSAAGTPRYSVRRDGGRAVVEKTVGGQAKTLFTGPSVLVDHLDMLTAVAVSPSGETAYLGCGDLRHVWVFQLGGDGVLSGGEPYCPLRTRPGQETQAVTALTVDALGRLYAATDDGVQAFDPTGRMLGVIALPAKRGPESVGWEGEKGDVLAVTIGGKKYVRVMAAAGAKSGG